jgi:hypothetical protein
MSAPAALAEEAEDEEVDAEEERDRAGGPQRGDRRLLAALAARPEDAADAGDDHRDRAGDARPSLRPLSSWSVAAMMPQMNPSETAGRRG